MTFGNDHTVIFDQFSRWIRQFQATLIFSHFEKKFLALTLQKSHFLTFGNDHTVIFNFNQLCKKNLILGQISRKLALQGGTLGIKKNVPWNRSYTKRAQISQISQISHLILCIDTYPRMNTFKVMSNQNFKNIFMVCFAQDSLCQDIGLPSNNSDNAIYF